MILIKKAVRAMLSNKRAYIACIILITIGILMYTAMGIAITALEESTETYYLEYNLADAFAEVTAIPHSGIENLKRIEGIGEVQGRQVYEARALIPGSDKVITLRLISVNINERPLALNDYLYTGRDFSNPDDIMIGSAFLEAHGLEQEDSVTLIIEGRQRVFQICAGADSPEYVYTIKDTTDMLPDPETFGIAFIQGEALNAFTNSYGVYNDLSFRFDEGYSLKKLETALEDELDKYGLMSLYDRDGHPSCAMMDTELKSVRSMSTSVPFVFVAMAMAILYLMMKRIIEQERMQIGTLKAFGYSNLEVVSHYMFYGGVTGLTGGLIGVALGYLASGSMLEIYKVFFRLPELNRNSAAGLIISGIIIGLAGGLAGAFAGARNILKLIPAEAMRPIAPKPVRKDILRRLPFLAHMLTMRGHMAVRSIGRNKFRSLFIVMGVTFSFGILAFMASYGSMIDDMMLNQFTKVQRYEGKISFNKALSQNSAVESVISLQGIKTAEGLLEIPAELKKTYHKESVYITGIQADSQLYKIYDNVLKRNLPISTEGLILSNGLAERLDVGIGDVLKASTNLLDDDIELLVTGVVNQNLGSNAYIELNALCRLFQLNSTATAVIFDTDDFNFIKDFVQEADNVSSLENIEYTRKLYEDFMAPYYFMIYMMEVMAVVVAFAIIYNTSSITLSERKREFSTMKVVGMHTGEVAEIVAFEYWILTFVGAILGIPFTGFLKEALNSVMETEMFSIPTSTPISAFVTAVIGCIVSVYLSNLSTKRSISKFDLVEVLKERE